MQRKSASSHRIKSSKRNTNINQKEEIEKEKKQQFADNQ